MRHRGLLLLALALPAAADSAQTVRTLLTDAATALSFGKPAAFLAAFDPAMAGFARLRDRVTNRANTMEVTSAEFLSDSGDDRARTLEMDWQVRIQVREGSPATTDRQRRVKCRVAQQSGQWRIVAFEPLDLFAPPAIDGAWNLFQSAASELANVQPSARLPGFLSAFDPVMPGLEQLRGDVGGWLARGDVQSSIELVRNEGSDTDRTVELDWTIEIVGADTGIQTFERQQRVTCKVVRRGKQWRIASFEPLAFFAPPPAK